MGIKVFVSGISASQDVRKKQQRVLFIMESLKIEHEVVDITEPGKEEEKALMREACAKHEKSNSLPPQIFLNEDYLGDYSDFELANENDNLLAFLKMAANKNVEEISKSNGVKNGDNVEASVPVDNNEEA